MYNELKIIIKYNVPELGEYSIDEELSIYKNKKFITGTSSMSDAKQNLSRIVLKDREDKIGGLRKTINNLELQSNDLESFRQKNNFS